MDLRKMMLPDGWYPKAPDEAERRLSHWTGNSGSSSDAVAALVPHAGWDFSGETAWNQIRQIPLDTELIIIAGGHLSPGSEPLVLDYDALETPFGPLTVDRAGVDEYCRDFAVDRGGDNTVEIQLPMVKYHLPHVTVLPVRLPPDNTSSQWAQMIAGSLEHRKTFFLGSSDLSHYGVRFSYSDFGFGDDARDKIKKIDEDFLNALSKGEIRKALEMAQNRNCACSAGAAAGAAAFAAKKGASGRVEDHLYSYQIYDDGGDFVGYGSIIYTC